MSFAPPLTLNRTKFLRQPRPLFPRTPPSPPPDCHSFPHHTPTTVVAPVSHEFIRMSKISTKPLSRVPRVRLISILAFTYVHIATASPGSGRVGAGGSSGGGGGGGSNSSRRVGMCHPYIDSRVVVPLPLSAPSSHCLGVAQRR